MKFWRGSIAQSMFRSLVLSSAIGTALGAGATTARYAQVGAADEHSRRRLAASQHLTAIGSSLGLHAPTLRLELDIGTAHGAITLDLERSDALLASRFRYIAVGEDGRRSVLGGEDAQLQDEQLLRQLCHYHGSAHTAAGGRGRATVSTCGAQGVEASVWLDGTT